MRESALRVLAKNLLVASDRSRKEVLEALSTKDRDFVTKIMEKIKYSEQS